MSEYRFLNPYNFVRFMGKARPENDVLGNCPPPPHDRYTGLTGRISCKATAVTPLFVSDSHDVKGKEENAHKTYRFFKVDGHPAIPASSLRGMVRSVFEAVTNSCLAVFDDRTLSYRPPRGKRQLYKHSIGELLPFPREQYVSCREYDKLCPACRVFGWVKDKAESEDDRETLTAYASRVRFSYGEYTEGSAKVLDATTLAVLSSPKPTTSAFYLLKNDKPNATVHYDTSGARLRGRKLYHHHGKQLSGQEYMRPSNIKDRHNRTIEGALGAGAVFTFEVDFENLAPKELGALLYTLELEDGLFHRLGYAKPLGFGSIQVTVESLQVLDWESRLSSVDLTAGWENELTGAKRAEYKEEFHRAMREHYGTDYENNVLVDLRGLLGEPPEIPIHYPRPGEQPDPEGRNYEWFVGNKARIRDRQRKEPKLPAPCALPLAADESEENSLPLIDRSGRRPARGR